MVKANSSEAQEEPVQPAILSKREESEAAFWRLKRASDKWRENRVKRVLAQEGEGILTTFGRMFYVCACLIFDGPVMMQIPVSLGKSTGSWILYVVLLVVAINYQREFYDRWFSVDLTQIDFDRQ